MQRTLVFPLAALLLIPLACSAGATTPPPAATNAPAGLPVSFENVSFVIPQGLAASADGVVVPAADESNSDPWSVAPQHLLFKLSGYPTTSSFEPVVTIYPAADYATANGWAAVSIQRLQALLASPSAALSNETLSTVPFYGAAAQQYAAQARRLSFNGGSGVRMLSQYGQAPGPITRDNSFYHFEGLTADGKYLVAVVLPVTLPLQSTAANPSADGVTYPGDISDVNGLKAYYQGVTALLDAAAPDSFQPSLALLDALVQSIQVK